MAKWAHNIVKSKPYKSNIAMGMIKRSNKTFLKPAKKFATRKIKL